MHRYFIKTPWWVKKFFPQYVWHVPTDKKEVFLTFDDGPHPQITPWVLDELKKYEARATFFCVGNNVVQHPDVFARITAEGHAVGNHTHTHVNGWKTPASIYLQNVAQAADVISTSLFRPPYGRISNRQAAAMNNAMSRNDARIIMWDVLSADFDVLSTPEKCLKNVLRFTEKGSVVVFHDSEKAEKNLKFALPRALEELSEKGYTFSAL